MNRWFRGISKIEELRKRYRELLKQYHPDNGGNEETMKEINLEYDRVFADLSRFSSNSAQCTGEEQKAENEAFKSVMEQIAHINATVEVIGSWLWVHGGYEYRELLKSVGFRFAPKKKCWCWHYGEYRKYHKREVPLDEIRAKYGSRTVHNKSKQFALD